MQKLVIFGEVTPKEAVGALMETVAEKGEPCSTMVWEVEMTAAPGESFGAIFSRWDEDCKRKEREEEEDPERQRRIKEFFDELDKKI